MDKDIRDEIIINYLVTNGYHKVAKKLVKVQKRTEVKCPDRLILAIVSNCLIKRGHEKVAKKLAQRKTFSNMNLICLTS